MNLRQLKHFLSIAEAGSLVAAARRLGVAQPSLTRDLKLLEEILDARLFVRDGRGVTLTRDGKIFHDSIAPHVTGIERAREDFFAKRSGRDGAIRLGWTGTISIPIGAEIIESFTRSHPLVELHARGGSSAQIIDWISSGTIDIGIFNSERPATGRFAENLTRAGLYLATASRPDAEAGPISFADAAKYPLFVHSEQNALGRMVRACARDNGLSLNISAEVDDIATVCPIIAQREAAAIAPRGLLLAANDLGPVDKVDSQISGSMIQDCLLGGGFGSRRPDRYGMADHRGAVAHRAWKKITSRAR